MPRRPRTQIVAGSFARPVNGLRFSGDVAGLSLSGAAGWQSNGGRQRGHPARSLPFTLEAHLERAASLARLYLVGIFALYADQASEPLNTLGASLQLVRDRETVYRQDLVNGRHYGDARQLASAPRINGDGTSLEAVGVVLIDDVPARVDLLTIDFPPDTVATGVRLKDMGSPASFVVFDVLIEEELGRGCPFHPDSGGIALGEIASIVRVGDRVKFGKALMQLEESIRTTPDLDEARGQALTFLAMVTAATLEMGGSREMHRIQLEAARELDRQAGSEAIAASARSYVEQVAAPLFQESQSPSSYLVDRALSIVERHYAKNLVDSAVASQLGLSTSHFRFLFREATGQPFHKYVVALRLEKARQMLLEEGTAVSVVAKAVGFTGLSHFSRAFTQRCSVRPTPIRRGAA